MEISFFLFAVLFIVGLRLFDNRAFSERLEDPRNWSMGP